MQPPIHGESNKTTAPSREPLRPEADLPAAWREILTGHPPVAPHAARGNLGFFLELVRSDITHAAAIEAAPLLLTGKLRGQPARTVPLDAQRLAHARLSPAEQHLAASVLGLPLTTRKARHYAHLTGPTSDALLTDMLDTTPCYLGGVAGLHLARGKARRLL